MILKQILDDSGLQIIDVLIVGMPEKNKRNRKRKFFEARVLNISLFMSSYMCLSKITLRKDSTFQR